MDGLFFICLGERYVYKFVCDPDALFQMALAENHRTALKMEATCIAAAASNNPTTEIATPPEYPHQFEFGAKTDHGNRCRHQYSDMLDQVYTSHMHAKFQLQQQHQQQNHHQQQQQQQQLQQQHKMFAQHQSFIGSPENYNGHLSPLEQFVTVQKDKVSKIKSFIFTIKFFSKAFD